MRRRRRVYIEEPWRPYAPQTVPVLPPLTGPPLSAEVQSTQGLTLRLTIHAPATASREAQLLLEQEISEYQLNDPIRLRSFMSMPNLEMIPLTLRIRVVRVPPEVTVNGLHDGILSIRYRTRPVPKTP